MSSAETAGPFPIEESFIGLINLTVDVSTDPGRLTARLPVTRAVMQPMGIVHGGIYASIAETLASMATANAVRADGKLCMGMSNNTSFLRPVSAGTIHAEATALHRGRTTWVWDIEMRDDAGRLCSTSRVTMAVRDA
jgi:1,4-dihydroxy-2-naphthoyl-CoA hydrolase